MNHLQRPSNPSQKLPMAWMVLLKKLNFHKRLHLHHFLDLDALNIFSRQYLSSLMLSLISSMALCLFSFEGAFFESAQAINHSINETFFFFINFKYRVEVCDTSCNWRVPCAISVIKNNQSTQSGAARLSFQHNIRTTEAPGYTHRSRFPGPNQCLGCFGPKSYSAFVYEFLNAKQNTFSFATVTCQVTGKNKSQSIMRLQDDELHCMI